MIPLVILVLGLTFGAAFAQTPNTSIDVPPVQPCFLNLSAGYHLWEQCNARGDYLAFILGPWEWITGGWFSAIIIMLLVGITWLKYQQAIYPLFIGMVYLPVAFFIFPDIFLSWAIIMAFAAIGITIWWIFIRQTR